MQLLGVLVGLIYRSLFQSGEEGLKRTHWTFKLALLLILILLYFRFYTRPYIPLGLVIVYGVMSLGSLWTLSTFTLSSIPAVWYGVTAYLYAFFSSNYSLTPLGALMIYFRTTYISFLILFIASILSPVQLSRILFSIGLKKESLFPLILWRSMPAGISDMLNSLAIGSLKGEKSWKRLGPALASMLEYGQNVWRINYYKLESEPLIAIKYEYSKRHTLLIILFIFIGAILLII